MDIVQQQIFQRLIEKLMTRNNSNNHSNNFYYNNYNNTSTTTTTTTNKLEVVANNNSDTQTKVNNYNRTMEEMMEKLKENHQIMDTTNSSDDGLKNGGYSKVSQFTVATWKSTILLSLTLS